MPISSELQQLIDETPLIDTHEHLAEEKTRVEQEVFKGPWGLPIYKDFSLLFPPYGRDDLVSAGLPKDSLKKFFDPRTEVPEKWKIIAPFYANARNTGYFRNMRESLQLLIQEEDVTESNCERISEKLRALIQPGYYLRILRDLCKIEYCQVNSLENDLFMETAQPELLAQDLSFLSLSINPQIESISRQEQIEIKNLKDWHNLIDHCYDKYGPRAIALKNQGAYTRPLHFKKRNAEEVASPFQRYLKDPDQIAVEEWVAVQDHLFHYCLEKAQAFRLPIKLHSGYFSGTGYMPLSWLRHHAGEISELLVSYPHLNFIIMHIIYPYAEEAIALAKHFPNAYIDMCWAWTIDPVRSIRFIKEFLTAAPANKLLVFGGDVMQIELLPGQVKMARRGLAQALSELVEEGWIEKKQVEKIVYGLMQGNAKQLFRYSEVLSRWKK